MQRKVTPGIVERMRHLKEKGLTHGEIAEKTSLSLSTVTRYLREAQENEDNSRDH